MPVLLLATALGWGGMTAPAAVGMSIGPALAEAATATAPAAFWPLDETTTATVHDVVGGHDGIVEGTVTPARTGQGPGTTGFGFDGASGVVRIAAPGLAPGEAAASAWLRTTDRASTGTVVDAGGLTIAVIAGHAAATTCAQSNDCVVLTSADVADGSWHQVAVSVAGTTTSLYVDGVLAATGNSGGTAAPPVDGEVTIGRGFDGDVDRVALYAAPVTAATVAAEFRRGACPQAAASTTIPAAVRRLPALPLHTRGRFVVDARGHRVKLAGVNWYGAEELDRVPAGLQCRTIDAIASRIVAGGFNVVRLPWATATWTGAAPGVPPVAVAANPQLTGQDARAVFDAVVTGLARHGLMVILDNHVSRPDWCCSGTDGNALWWQGYDPHQPPPWRNMTVASRIAYFRAGQARWLGAWRAIVARYHAQQAVVGVDLRNEPRPDALLGIGDAWSGRHLPVWADWPRAAARGGNAVLAADPHLLVAVEGTAYATDLRGVAARPVRLTVAHRLLYSAHDYAWTDPAAATPAQLRRSLRRAWGWLLVPHRARTTPVWVGEFGTCHTEAAWCHEQRWFAAFTRYLRRTDGDWAYWAVNGTGARGATPPGGCAVTPRFPGCDEGYGLTDATWGGDASPSVSAVLRALSAA